MIRAIIDHRRGRVCPIRMAMTVVTVTVITIAIADHDHGLRVARACGLPLAC